MHPPLLPRALPLAQRGIPATARAFTTSIPLAEELRPESPNFIEVPRPPKPVKIWTPPPKGFIPEPRRIFQRTSAKSVTKDSWYFLARATPPKMKGLSGPAPDNLDHPTKVEVATKIKWRRAMAESRKRNLREGVLELAQRHREYEAKRTAISERRRREREERLAAKEADDVRLTLPTVLSSIKDEYPIPDPDRAARIDAKKAAREKILEKWEMQRREKIHELYVNAREFIVSEAQLDEVINASFREDDLAYREPSLPPSATTLIRRLLQPLPADQHNLTRSNAKIAEVYGAITGGKMLPSKLTQTYKNPTNFHSPQV